MTCLLTVKMGWEKPWLIILATCGLIAGSSGSLPERNCSKCVVLGEAANDQCTHVKGDVGDGSGFQLSAYLSDYNDKVSANDCLEVRLSPGLYTLDSIETTNVTYSIILVAVEKEAIVSCQPTVNETLVTNSPLWFQRPSSFSPHSSNGELFVQLEGVRFQNCPRPLRFDTLDYVGISNCSFS